MRYRYILADVFTRQPFGGNPLAVFPEAVGLTTELMQKIAGELHLSETVFVFPPADPAHTHRLRIFTPGMELPFAGHPTVGTAFILTAAGYFPLEEPETRLSFEEGAGTVPVTVRAHGGIPHSSRLTAPQLPQAGPEPPPRKDLAALLSLPEGDLLNGEWRPQTFSCGTPFTFIPLASPGAVSRARLDLAVWERLLAGSWGPHVYLFCLTPGKEAGLHARMFAPAMGIVEDPATGAAASALAGYLARRQPHREGTLHWSIEQGVEIGRPSRIEVEADLEEGCLTAVRTGGNTVIIGEGRLDLPVTAGSETE